MSARVTDRGAPGGASARNDRDGAARARRLSVLALTPGFPLGDRAHRPAIVDTLERLVEHHDVEVHALRPPPDAPGTHVYRGLRVVGYGGGPKLVRFAALARAIARRASDFDVLWALWVDRTGPAALALGRLLGKPVVLSVMGGELADLAALDYGWARTPLRRSALVRMAAEAARITVGSELLAARLTALAPASAPRVRVTPVGTPELPRRSARGPARAALPTSAPRSALSLVAISDLSPVKRPELLVDVLATLVDRGHDARLEVYGETAPLRLAVVEARARALGVFERLVLRGFVEPRALWAELERFDVLVHASAHESQGCALIEAAFAELPIATTSVGVAGELAASGAAIAICSSPTGEALADAVLTVRARAPEPDVHARLVARYELDAAARAFARVFEEATVGKGAQA